jgi:antitoxin component YwqK of YwqJK toxin-antitoxin module
MVIGKNKFKTLFIIYFSLFLLNGCHTFYKVEQNELNEISKNDVVQITFLNGEKLTIKNIIKINYLENQKIEFIRFADNKYISDSIKTVYSLESINEIRIEKFDPQKSVFTTFWITFGVTLCIFIILGILGVRLTFA